MPEANISDIKRFFKTGDPERDSMQAFAAEWRQLSDVEKLEIKTLVGEALAP